ncbi:hypothetical protein EVAR_21476_1 [Eumeta japonica]|uniref:Uncharacterized protein n=1 Tax=Eumeta variegata TaxID=151549 RepID=A0A4C1ZPB0_EUMVA|nr:hypothetical protein EVAR_21476_1 [Eumeta japonica]
MQGDHTSPRSITPWPHPLFLVDFLLSPTSPQGYLTPPTYLGGSQNFDIGGIPAPSWSTVSNGLLFSPPPIAPETATRKSRSDAIGEPPAHGRESVSFAAHSRRVSEPRRLMRPACLRAMNIYSDIREICRINGHVNTNSKRRRRRKAPADN